MLFQKYCEQNVSTCKYLWTWNEKPKKFIRYYFRGYIRNNQFNYENIIND